MNTPAPVSKDPTLTATPHVVSVIVGAIAGFLASKGVPADYVAYATIAATTLGTTAVHWIMAKLSA